MDSSDDVYVTEFHRNPVQRFTFDGVLIGRWGSEGSENGQFQNTTGISIDSEGNVYISESGNYWVQKFGSECNWITPWRSQGSGEGEFLSAMVIAVDADNRLHVSDWGNSTYPNMRRWSRIFG